MAERGYFSFRYAIPGYTFILLVVAINYVPILTFLEKTDAGAVFGAFLGFLSLFTGSALGFLFSQVWYWWFIRERAKKPNVYGIKELEQADEAWMEKLRNLGLNKEAEDNKEAMLAIADYIVHRKKELLLGYAQRRWDMYHLLSSTFHTLWIGLVVALSCRVYFENFLYGSLFTVSRFQELISIPLWENAEAIAIIVVIIAVCLWLILFRKIRGRFMIEYCPVLEAFIRKVKIEKSELKQVFPKFFSQQNGRSRQKETNLR